MKFFALLSAVTKDFIKVIDNRFQDLSRSPKSTIQPESNVANNFLVSSRFEIKQRTLQLSAIFNFFLQKKFIPFKKPTSSMKRELNVVLREEKL